MKKLKATVSLYFMIVSIGLGIGNTIYQFIFSWNNPEHTTMMIFQKFWIVDIIVVAIMVTSFELVKMYCK